MRQFPKGSDERDAKKNDSAAGVYVVFPKRWLIPESIKYVWSESAPVGTEILRSHRFPAVIIRSGEQGMNEWKEESRNVAADFQKLFGRKAPNPVAIGFLTDANSVKGTASADYDDIRVMVSAPSGP